MKGLLRGVMLVIVGMVLGGVVMSSSASQQRRDGVRVNHVGISVSNFEEAVHFYTATLGFHEAYTLRDERGNPTMAAIQISRETFLELAPANANRAPGLTHVGIEADDIQATVVRLRRTGAQIADPRLATNTNATLTNVTGPDGVRIEFLQLNPDSLQRRAITSWQ
jgi:catechol 2,3-dioxygenase-like lactoylglutathione lyase family enzyme